MLSIVIACKNSYVTLVNTINSIESQIQKDFFEVIIIDASSDNKIKNHFLMIENTKYRYYHFLDMSIYEAWNFGILNSKGDSIFFLNSDDTLYDNKNLFELYKVHVQEKNDLTYAKILYHTKQGLTKSRGGEVSRFRFVFGMDKTLLTLSTIFKKNIFNTIGYFDTKYLISSDVDLIYRCLLSSTLKISYYPILLINMYEGGISSTKRNIGMKEFQDIINRYENIFFIYLFYLNEYIIRNIKKKLLKFRRFIKLF